MATSNANEHAAAAERVQRLAGELDAVGGMADVDLALFPAGFLWGAATSAFQIEGAWRAGGKGPSVWDAWLQIPGKAAGGATGEEACDHYHRYREDVALMRDRLGLSAYRLSVSWPRVMPDGRTVSEEGLAFYSALVDELLAAGIAPCVTLFHWDTPLALQLELDGWLGGDQVVAAFARFAEAVFARLADRVKTWFTLNEPYCVAFYGYAKADSPPGRACPAEALRAAHNMLLAHAEAVHVFRTKFQPVHGGEIGIVLNSAFKVAQRPEDGPAAERSLVGRLGWFADPVYTGDYPALLREGFGELLPRFTAEQSERLRGSADFLGLNLYSTRYASDLPADAPEAFDFLAAVTRVREWPDPAWRCTALVGMTVAAFGLREMLLWLHRRYPKWDLQVTESGLDDFDDPAAHPGADAAADDPDRERALARYIAAVGQALRLGVPVRAYFVWSLMDNLEWQLGYGPRFGIVAVDRATQRRTVKRSGAAYGALIKRFRERPPAAASATE